MLLAMIIGGIVWLGFVTLAAIGVVSMAILREERMLPDGMTDLAASIAGVAIMWAGPLLGVLAWALGWGT